MILTSNKEGDAVPEQTPAGPDWVDQFEKLMNAFGTRGGAIMVLLLSNTALLCVIVHMLHHGETSGALAVTISTIFGNFTGALLMVLTGKDKDKPNGNGAGK